MKKLLTLLLSVLLLASCTTTNKVVIDENKDYTLPVYYHYEPDEFYKKCDELKGYIETNDKKKAFELYDEMYKEALSVLDLTAVCYIDYCEDVNNEYYIDEQQYIETVFDELNNKFLTLCHSMTESSFANDFKKHINNEDMYSDYVEYVEKSQEELDLLARENELIQKSNEIRDKTDDYTYTYEGKEYTSDEIYDIEDDELYAKLIEGLDGKINADLGEIYVELVGIRDKIAKLNGYDNYALYADSEMYYRDYTEEDLRKFKDVVKSHGSDIIYYIYNGPSYIKTDVEEDKLIEDTMSILTTISPYINTAHNIFENNNLYSITRGDGRYKGSYEYSMTTGSAFVFINLGKKSYDYFTLAHEFGHFTNAITVNNPSPLTREGCYDVFEIHSTGLEMLFGNKAQDIFKENYDDQMMADILEALDSVLVGCIYDEFQRRVYENPNMSLDEINQTFKDVMFEYGWDAYDGYPSIQYEWMYVPHNFDSPMYYVSYGTSAFAALQIWAKSRSNFDEAVKVWENILVAPAYNDGYMKIVSDAGLSPFSNPDSTEEVLKTIFDYFEENTAEE